MKIIIDSREQLPLEFKVGGNITDVSVRGLPIGDYAAEWEPESNKPETNCEMPIVFDRKNISDLFGTLSSGMDRFKKEIERANENKIQLILIVEGSICDVLGGTKYSSIEGKTILKTMFSLFVKYNVIPVFCNNRSEMIRFIVETFEAIGRNYKH